MSTENHGYDASMIQVLEGLDAVRKRPGMYIGSTGERGLHHLAFGLVGHVMGEQLDGRSSRIDVALTADGGLRVRGEGSSDPSGLPVAATTLSAGWRRVTRHHPFLLLADDLAVLNALSARMVIEVRHDGARWELELAQGLVVTPLADAGPASDTGTTVTFWPDTEIFETTEFSWETLAEGLRESAAVYPELSHSLTDERDDGAPRTTRFPGGLGGLVAFLDGAADPEVITFERDDPRMPGELAVAMRWREAGAESRGRSFANGHRTDGGGTHLDGFMEGLTSAVNTYAWQRELTAEGDPDLGWDQVAAGLTAVVSVKLDDDLAFVGATRDRLGTPSVARSVAQAVREHVTTWLADHPAEAEALIGRMTRRV